MKFFKGDLLDTPTKFLMHGCNGQGVMGSGVALAVKTRWPQAFKEYHEYCFDADGNLEEDLLGSVQYSDVDNKSHVLVNAITQEYFGVGKQARYTAIVRCSEMVWEDYLSNLPVHERVIAIPKIGCGLGGLKWEIVEELLLEMEEFLKMEFWVYEL